MSQQRADLLLVSLGLLPTRAKARQAIEAGLVSANGKQVKKPSEMLDPNSKLRASAAYEWVSRAGLKLVAALDQFGVDPAGRNCLDIGASTGGFTQVLLSRGAAHVLAVDVGRGQLDASLRDHAALTSLEGQDARALTNDQIGDLAHGLIVMDVSFIGVEKILPYVLGLIAGPVELIILVKPQFQAGPQRVGKGGIVDPDLAVVIAEETRAMLATIEGLVVTDMIESPVLGGDGNREFLLHAQRVDS
jgi:23S rRNA (cytidine1920-2'-O)/16S rRNA (cytidine1409-2'-O)-methyltransferase